MVGVDTKDYIESDARKFAEQQHAKVAQWVRSQRSRSCAKAYGVTGLPVTFFIDSRGVIRGHVYQGLTQEILDQQLAKITKPSTS